jgi:glyoxylase-like metal-dependent hydrolase (beta-lactamase superfamily II)
MTEIADGIHRIESDLGPRFMCQYVVAGDDRSVLVDTGLADTPAAVIDPYLSRAGLEPDFVLTSHADNDHVGGNRAYRDAHRDAVFVCHELDRRWVESNEALVRENYGWHAAYGFPPMDVDELLASMSGDSPVDVGLAGGETIRLDANRVVEVLHLPGHTAGHLGLWDERTRAAIVIDAALADGIYDRAGNKLIPPRYYDLGALRQTIARLEALRPELLLTAHYPVLERDEALEWLATGRAFVDDVERVVRDASADERDDLWSLTRRVDSVLGPFPEFTTELGATVREAVTSGLGASRPTA